MKLFIHLIQLVAHYSKKWLEWLRKNDIVELVVLDEVVRSVEGPVVFCGVRDSVVSVMWGQCICSSVEGNVIVVM